MKKIIHLCLGAFFFLYILQSGKRDKKNNNGRCSTKHTFILEL